MAHKFVDGESLARAAAVPFSCKGGLDIDSPKLEAYPGTLQGCLNFESTERRGYTMSEGLLEFNGAYFTFPLYSISLDEVFAYYPGSPETFPINWFAHTPGQIFKIRGGGAIQIISIDTSVNPTRIRAQVVEGAIPDVNVNIDLHDGFPDSSRLYTLKVKEKGYPSTRATWQSYYTAVSPNIESDFSVRLLPFTGPVTGMWEFNDQIYVAACESLPSDPSYIYKQPDMYDPTGTWEQVDMGHEIAFKEGGNAFLSSMFEQYEDVVAGNVSPVPSGNLSTVEARDVQWVGKDGVTSSTINTTSASFLHNNDTKSAEVTFTGSNQETSLLRLGGFDIDIDRYATIKGIQVSIVAGADANGKATISEICLFDGDSEVPYVKNVETALSTFTTNFSYGGPNDTWQDSSTGTPSLTAVSLAKDEFGIGIRLKSSSAAVWPAKAAVYQVEITVYYESGSNLVYFYDAGEMADFGTAKVLNSVKLEGNWDTVNADGIISVSDLSVAEEIIEPNFHIRTGPNGTGTLLAKVKAQPYPVALPSWDAIQAESSMLYTIAHNFYSDEKRRAVYGVTGASPAFAFNGENFVYLRTGVEDEREKPRHISHHAQHLLLGYGSGHVLHSAPGKPHSFTATGAGDRGYGHPIVGMAPLKGEAHAIFTEKAVHALVGSTLISFRDQIISPTSGAMEYTVQNLSEPMFFSRSGASTISSVETYGDFNVSKLTGSVYSWINEKFTLGRGEARGAVKFAYTDKSKNQYRVFFQDGDILTLTLVQGPDGMSVEPSIQNYFLSSNDEIISYCTGVVQNKQDVVLFGTKRGHLWSAKSGLNAHLGNSENNTRLENYIEFNPFQSGEGFMNFKFNEGAIHGVSMVSPKLIISAGVNYLETDEDNTSEEYVDFGSGNGTNFDVSYISAARQHSSAKWYLPSITDGYSIKIKQDTGVLPVYTFQHLIIRPRPSSSHTSNPRRP